MSDVLKWQVAGGMCATSTTFRPADPNRIWDDTRVREALRGGVARWW